MDLLHYAPECAAQRIRGRSPLQSFCLGAVVQGLGRVPTGVWLRRLTLAERMAFLVALALVAPTGAALAKDPPFGTNYGPAPDWAHYRELVETELRHRLIDPDSAKVRWPNFYIQRGFTPFLSKRVYGYATCGYLNSRNRMGGYAGEAPFIVVIDHDQVLYLQVAKSTLDAREMAQLCDKGGFPPAPSDVTASTAQVVPQANRFGFTLTAVPDGAYIATVASGSPAERAGLKPGLVISSLNGVALKGMAAATVEQMFGGTQGEVTLQTIGGGTVRLADTRPAPKPSSGAHP